VREVQRCRPRQDAGGDCDAAVETEVVRELQLRNKPLKFGEIIRLQYLAGDAERRIVKSFDHFRGSPDEHVVALDAPDIAHGRDQELAHSLGWPGGCFPVGKVEAVIDCLHATGVDAIHLDGMAPDLLGNRKHRVRSPAHEPIGNTMLVGSENAHVSARPYQFGA
jgi:hypothetical protein